MAYSRLDHHAREVIMSELARDRCVSFTQIAARVGCHRSTVQREIKRNSTTVGYSSRHAHEQARFRQRREGKFERDQELADQVRRDLVAGYSPYAISSWLPVSAETIYQGIYSGILGLRPQEVLRTRRPHRRHRYRKQPTSDGNYLGDFTPISQRPTAVDARDEFGHWEGDLVTGSANQSAVVTLVERVSRYQYVLELPHGHGTRAVITALSKWLDTHNRQVLSLTWDRGAELTRWPDLVNQHGIDIYFCDPKSPWQRATSENQNRQLRFWLRKGTDLTNHNQNDLNHYSHILNTTPRRLHNGATAHHIYQQHPRTRE